MKYVYSGQMSFYFKDKDDILFVETYFSELKLVDL